MDLCLTPSEVSLGSFLSQYFHHTAFFSLNIFVNIFITSQYNMWTFQGWVFSAVSRCCTFICTSPLRDPTTTQILIHSRLNCAESQINSNLDFSTFVDSTTCGKRMFSVEIGKPIDYAPICLTHVKADLCIYVP